ncbi:hypothetical protein LSAT2_004772 [Lamellibrachia satsuma]|nr:hypothetical protein LSAT2_004772 [Lamellibrachia satsuma]
MPRGSLRQSPRKTVFTHSVDECSHTPARYNPLHLPESMGIPFEMRVSGYWKNSPERCMSHRCHLCDKCVEERKRPTCGDDVSSFYKIISRHVNTKLVVCFCSCVLVFWAARRCNPTQIFRVPFGLGQLQQAGSSITGISTHSNVGGSNIDSHST